jgi:preprotein translocase subunit SecD
LCKNLNQGCFEYMLRFSWWKLSSILAICAFFALLALPSVLSDAQVKALPEMFPHRRISLGLDLQGGSHLLLKVDTQSYFAQALEGLRSSVRGVLRANKIGYTELVAEKGHVSVTIRSETVAKDANVLNLLKSAASGVNIEEAGDNRYVIGYSDVAYKEKSRQLVAQTIEIIGRRLDETGTKELSVQQQGEDRILLQVPGLQDPTRLKELLGTTAKMTFHLVNPQVTEAQLLSKDVPLGTIILPSEERDDKDGKVMPPRPYALIAEPALSGEALVDASSSLGAEGQPVVAFRFDSAGAQVFGEITKQHIGQQFAIVLDGKVITAPVIRSAILGGSGIIEGNFTIESATNLALLLRAGALPADVTVLEERTVGPSLGSDSIAAGKLASSVAIGLVALFMVVGYGLFGAFSVVALAVNLVLMLGLLSLVQATLTMPGIAGMVLTLAMAVDANVLIFERMREEEAKGKSVLASIENGFSGAFGTIFDSNLTTLIAAGVLFYFGSGTIKGFAVTLSFGIICSMFTAIAITRLLIVLWVKGGKRKALPM